jgi:hypothetical protein
MRGTNLLTDLLTDLITNPVWLILNMIMYHPLLLFFYLLFLFESLTSTIQADSNALIKFVLFL